MSWFSRFFFRSAPKASPVRPLFAILVPEGCDPEIWKRARPPKRNRKKHAPEEITADEARYAAEMRAKFTSVGRFERERAQSVGCETFVWRSAGDSDVCADCAKNNGKRFSYARPPAIGHPGEHACPIGWCRCIAEPVIPSRLR